MNYPRANSQAMEVSMKKRHYLSIACCGMLLLLSIVLSGCTGATGPEKSTIEENNPSTRIPIAPSSGSPTSGQNTSENLSSHAQHQSFEKEPGIRFRDVANEMGIDFSYQNGAKGQMLFHEPFGGGHGWLDYDLDGRVDLYLVQGGDGTSTSKQGQPNDQLLRNSGDQFLNVTANVELDDREYGQGVAIADFDNDGFDDIYVTNLGPNKLFKNQGDGTFEEVSQDCNVDCPAWSTSAAWIDVDLDGNLDLYVCNYVKHDPMNSKSCVDANGNPVICNPLSFEPEPDVFYRNDGQGSFRELTKERGLLGPNNRALGVASADFDQDGWPDLYIANDATNNFLFRNLKNGYFEEVAVELGCATDRRGAPQASMGLAVNDYDGDGKLDIYSTHFQSESNTLYRNLGASGFIDTTGSVGLHTPTLDKLGFGTVMQDLNQDGCMEIFVANGHIDNSGTNPDEKMAGQLFTYQRKKWNEISSVSGDWFQKKFVSRGATFADFDLDGRIDLGVTHQSASMSLLHNESKAARVCWLKLVGVTSNRNGLGAKVTFESNQGQRGYEIIGGGSYCSASWSLVPIPVDSNEKAGKINISWPSGTQQQVEIPHYGVLAISTEKATK